MNKANHIFTGEEGERLAVEYLTKKGYTVLETRWKYKHKEIDIIATYKDWLVVVEVKTRRSRIYGNPQEAVDSRKQAFLIEAAEAYIENFFNFKEIRFDVVAIILQQGNVSIQHIENAFIPGL